MGTESEKNQQNPGQRHPGEVDPNRKDPTQSGENVHNPQQDPTRKNPGQESGTGERRDGEVFEDAEKRRAS